MLGSSHSTAASIASTAINRHERRFRVGERSGFRSALIGRFRRSRFVAVAMIVPPGRDLRRPIVATKGEATLGQEIVGRWPIWGDCLGPRIMHHVRTVGSRRAVTLGLTTFAKRNEPTKPATQRLVQEGKRGKGEKGGNRTSESLIGEDNIRPSFPFSALPLSPFLTQTSIG